MDKNEIGALLRKIRTERGVTQAQLAAAAGVSQGTIGNIESGIRGYGESLVDIARALAVTPELLRGESNTYSLERNTGLTLVKESAVRYEAPDEGDDFIELLSLFQQSSKEGKQFILDSARSAEKATGARWIRAKAGNKS